jgi:hypothetical protein
MMTTLQHIRTLSPLRLLLLLLNSHLLVSSFTIVSSPTCPSFERSSKSTSTSNINNNQHIHPSVVTLYGRKKGGLQDVDLTAVNTSANANANASFNNNSKKNNKKKNKKNTKEEVQVSSSLSQWAATAATQDFQSLDTNDNDTNNNIQKKSNKEKRSSKTSPSSTTNTTTTTSKQTNQRIQTILSSIQEIISSNNFNVSSLLELLSTLITIQEQEQQQQQQSIPLTQDNNAKNTFLLSLLNRNEKKKKVKSNNRTGTGMNINNYNYNYNLAWVGSDDAICHLGTGLHKVPLARLQDIFMTLSSNNGSGDGLNIPSGLLMGGKNLKNSGMITVMEVIRILGPFPNVRNTLQGRISMSVVNNNNKAFGSASVTSNTSTSDKGDRVTITYESMMDGLGKEIKAGNDNNVRNVDLNILFADENAIVCTVPTTSDDEAEATTSTDNDSNDSNDALLLFGKNGKNVLLFLKEDDLDGKLEGLRAA